MRMPDYKTATWEEILAFVMRPTPGPEYGIAYKYGRLQAVCEQLIVIRDTLKYELEKANEHRNY